MRTYTKIYFAKHGEQKLGSYRYFCSDFMTIVNKRSRFLTGKNRNLQFYTNSARSFRFEGKNVTLQRSSDAMFVYFQALEGYIRRIRLKRSVSFMIFYLSESRTSVKVYFLSGSHLFFPERFSVFYCNISRSVFTVPCAMHRTIYCVKIEEILCSYLNSSCNSRCSCLLKTPIHGYLNISR